MLSLRLARVGRKNQASFRLIAVDRTKDNFGKSVEILGNYTPRLKDKPLQLKRERIEYWLSKGAQPSPSVHNLFVKAGIISEKKVKTSHMTKKRAAKIEAEKPTKSADSSGQTPTDAEVKAE